MNYIAGPSPIVRTLTYIAYYGIFHWVIPLLILFFRVGVFPVGNIREGIFVGHFTGKEISGKFQLSLQAIFFLEPRKSVGPCGFNLHGSGRYLGSGPSRFDAYVLFEWRL